MTNDPYKPLESPPVPLEHCRRCKGTGYEMPLPSNPEIWQGLAIAILAVIVGAFAVHGFIDTLVDAGILEESRYSVKAPRLNRQFWNP